MNTLHGECKEPWDFNDWMTLSRSNPTAFEERRRRVIEEAIASAPQHLQPRLHALQWRIDMERARASNPLSACIRLSNMMWKMIYGEHGMMSAIGRLTGYPASAKGGATSTFGQDIAIRTAQAVFLTSCIFPPNREC